jgi:hypothetical protein
MPLYTLWGDLSHSLVLTAPQFLSLINGDNDCPLLGHPLENKKKYWVLVTHTCNLSYLGG